MALNLDGLQWAYFFGSRRESVDGEYNTLWRLGVLEAVKNICGSIFNGTVFLQQDSCMFPGELCKARVVDSCFDTSLSDNAARMRAECRNSLQKHSWLYACFIFFMSSLWAWFGCKRFAVFWPQCHCSLILFQWLWNLAQKGICHGFPLKFWGKCYFAMHLCVVTKRLRWADRSCAEWPNARIVLFGKSPQGPT